jgi:hypothetical protein
LPVQPRRQVLLPTPSRIRLQLHRCLLLQDRLRLLSPALHRIPLGRTFAAVVGSASMSGQRPPAAGAPGVPRPPPASVPQVAVQAGSRLPAPAAPAAPFAGSRAPFCSCAGYGILFPGGRWSPSCGLSFWWAAGCGFTIHCYAACASTAAAPGAPVSSAGAAGVHASRLSAAVSNLPAATALLRSSGFQPYRSISADDRFSVIPADRCTGFEC